MQNRLRVGLGVLALGVLVVAGVGLAANAFAAGGPILSAGSKVYVNGIDLMAISGIRGTSYSNVTVVFDAVGGVHLTIPGFAVAGPPAGPGAGAAAGPSATAAPAPPSGAGKKLSPDIAAIPLKFYLVTEVPRPGFVQYDIEIWVNDAYIGMIKNEDGPLAVDVNDKVKATGKNSLRFKATKRMDGDRRSSSPTDFIKVILAEGRLVSGAVLPETRLFEYTKTAADMASTTTDYEVTIKR
jgi:hypothetical protein